MTQVIATVTELRALRDVLRVEQQEALAKGHTCIRLCLGASCIASGALRIKAALEEELAERQMRQMPRYAPRITPYFRTDSTK